MDSRKVAIEIIEFVINIKSYMRSKTKCKECPTITEPQFRTLVNLEQSGKCGLKDLSEKIYVSSSSLCIMLNKLVEDNLVEREIDSKDRRNTFYSLSDNGKEFLSKEREKRLLQLQEGIERLSAEKRERLFKCIRELEEIFEEMK